jgi:hypothetical protein
MALSTLNSPLLALEDLVVIPKPASPPSTPPKPKIKCLTRDQRRDAVCEAWNAVGADELQALTRSMNARCQAVIDANGMHIPY